jgi:alkanesulfonate monooxygenase SsuD/methylene tetrahydromethanopterin reductase-like flavin-dependent oxidoreductase (luciferase family)
MEEARVTAPAGLGFGVNLNNREPLIAPGYGMPELLDLSQSVEELGFDSVWVGDSLFSKPRYESMALLSALSQRTRHVKLGTACIVTSPRNPLYLALEWATLDVLSGGRTIFGPCAGNPEQGVRREFEALGLDFDKRFAIFEEGLDVVRQLWTTGTVTHHGAQYDYQDISFFSGTEMGPLMPIQQPPPFWIVSNPRLVTDASDERMVRTMRTACRRILRYGEGWMTCCRAQHPEELVEQLGYLDEVAQESGDDASRLVISYQVTLNIGDSEEAARAAFGEYINQYYPELSKATRLENWGPVGSPEQIIDWFRTFAKAGVDHFICRFGSLDQFGQVERFAREVLPALREVKAVAAGRSAG